jgi:serine/threonine protein kinase
VLPTLQFGKYTISGILGPGGVTETYLAHRPEEAEHLYALKLLRSDRVEPEQLAAAGRRFFRAGRQLIGLIRPGLCPILEVSDDPKLSYLVSEYVPGSDLKCLMDLGIGEARPNRPCLDPLLVSLIGAEVARILHTIHLSKPALAHLNLCPGNIVVGRDGEVKLLDTGIAASLRGFTLQPIERWQYVAPEILGKDLVFHSLSERGSIAADLYSLGALLYQMLMGRLQSDGDSIEALRKQKLQPEVESCHLSSQRVAVLRALLAPDPEDRPQSALAVVEWLTSEITTSTERQKLIAKGIATLEKGTPALSQEIPILAEAQPSSSPVSNRASEEGTRTLTPMSEIHVPRRKWKRFIGLAVAGVVVLLGIGLAWQKTHSVKVNRTAKTQPHNPEILPDFKRDVELIEEAPAKKIPRVAGHLVVDTVPPGAVVWVDGVKRGKTFTDLVIGEGGHRIVVIAPGHRIFREVLDTTHGVILRRTLVPIESPTKGEGFLSVECKSEGDYPILLDEEETGLLCPVKSIPVALGKHLVGIFLPVQRKTTTIDVIVSPGNEPTTARFNE